MSKEVKSATLGTRLPVLTGFIIRLGLRVKTDIDLWP